MSDDMQTFFLRLAASLFSLLACASSISAHADQLASVKYVDSSHSVALIDANNSATQCALDRQIKNISPHLNWNKQVILLSDVDYVSVADVLACRGGKVSASRIPARVGFVVDVNLKRNIYLSLDAVSAGPLTFAATVARLGKTTPLADFQGMYMPEKRFEKIQEEGFDYDDSMPGRISPDGRYVSANGSMDCTDDSYPGIWDLQTRKKVVRPDGCEQLFTNGDD
ncbi:hypothetical protein P3T42_005958 [Paraburkholderia sp. GAS38]|uniref:hypothetical protein n=1 Tax=Paraburkholderia sp. GAS38 TaxID=3035133 RepID=UPI003D194C82